MIEQERIAKIEQSIANLESGLSELKHELSELKQTKAASATVPCTNSAETCSVPVPDSVPTAPVNEVRQTSSAADASTTAGPEKSTTTKKKSSGFEENLGGKVMGIIAAVLVFIGLFLFGSLMYERLGYPARVASLFLVSFLLLGAGLFFERKRTTWFTTSLVGCGFGAVYISLFISSLYFHLFSVEVLYLLLLFWLTGIGLYVFRRQSYVVASLGQVGIAFSVIFGCMGIESKGQFTFLCLYFTILSFLYLWLVLWRFLPNSKEKPYPWIQLVAAGLNLIQLWALAFCHDSLFGTYGSLRVRNVTSSVLLSLYSLALPLFFLLRTRRLANRSFLPWKIQPHCITKKNFSLYKAGGISILFYTFCQLTAGIVFDIVCRSVFSGDIPRGLFVLCGLLLSYLIVELFGTTGTEGRGACVFTAVFVAISLLFYNFTDLIHTAICIAFCVATALIGILGSECPVRSVLNSQTRKWEYVCKEEKGRCFPKFTACVYAFLLLFSYWIDDNRALLIGIFLFGLLFFAGMFLFLYTQGKKHRFSDGLKIEVYLFALFYLLIIPGYLLDFSSLNDFSCSTLLLSLLTLCNGFAYYSRFRRKITTPDVIDTGATVVIRLVHTSLWIWGLALLHSGAASRHPGLFVWLIILTLYMCLSGMYDQYNTIRNRTVLGIYFGLRVTIYMLVMLTAFDSIEGYLISCVLLCLAVLAVLAGFPLRLAALRIYGLCLAMFAVVKLLMIDIEHENSMETVLCFLGAGILCFAINFIYNHVKKKFYKDTP